MRAIDLVRDALVQTDEGFSTLVAEMRDYAVVQPVVRDGKASGNHALWVIGHLAFIEGVLTKCLTGDKNPMEHLAALFGTGTQPKADAGAYPSFDGLLAMFRGQRSRNIKLLEQIGDAGLDARPKYVPSGFEDAMKTTAHAFLLIALHQMVHYGQVADARRAAGLKPLL